MGHARRGPEPATRPGRQRRILLLAAYRCRSAAARPGRSGGRRRSTEDGIMTDRPESVRTVLLIAHVEREEATKVAATFGNDLRAEGVSVRVFDADAELLEGAGLDTSSGVEVV